MHALLFPFCFDVGMLRLVPAITLSIYLPRQTFGALMDGVGARLRKVSTAREPRQPPVAAYTLIPKVTLGTQHEHVNDICVTLCIEPAVLACLDNGLDLLLHPRKVAD